jgi:carboxylesterase type B
LHYTINISYLKVSANKKEYPQRTNKITRVFIFTGMSEGGRKHPVLVFIHGESYDWGSGNIYDGSILAGYADQVVVTLNYRLGILGFLNANVSPHTKARVANYGLMDQIAALHWIQQNIEYFGGDPNNVTLMGQGTGAACVNFLAISPTVMPGKKTFYFLIFKCEKLYSSCYLYIS